MKTSEKGIQLIKDFEKCRLTAYKALPTERYYTIGYGHYGSDVKKGQTITQEEADTLLAKDVQKFEYRVSAYEKYNWSQNEFDALVSFAYNIGNIDGLTNYGQRSKEMIAEKMLLYVKSGGQTINGLVKRRQAEKLLFLAKDAEVKKISDFYVKTLPNYNLRAEPNISANRIGNTDNGIFCKPIGYIGTCVKIITIDGIECYISSEALPIKIV